MARYTFGAEQQNLDPWGIRKALGPITVVEADSYRIDPGFVTFVRGDKAFLSIPHSKVSVVAELTDDNDLPFTTQKMTN